MANSNVSPGVYSKVIDLSTSTQSVAGTVGFIAIVCEKGRDNELVETTKSNFYTEFGTPNINYISKNYSQGMYVADSFFKNSDDLFVIRVMPGDAAYANMTFNYDSTTNKITISSSSNVSDETVIRGITNFDGDGTATDCALIICGAGRGSWYNDNYKIDVIPHANETKAAEGIYQLDVWKKLEEQDFDASSSTWVDVYGITQSFDVSFDPDKLTNAGDSMFIANIINTYVPDLEAYFEYDVCKDAVATAADWSEDFFVDDVLTPIDLANGSDGSLFTDGTGGAKALLVKAYSAQLPKVKGLDNTESNVVDEILDTDGVYFNIVLDGGYPADVKNAIYDFCKSLRTDVVGLLDIGDNKSSSQALAARTNAGTYSSFDDYHVALYDGYSLIYDAYTAQYIWITPIYHMASIVGFTEANGYPWTSPAGFNRATISGIKKLRYSPKQSERDSLYLAQINPIVKFSVGNTVFGQLTSQRKTSYLQDLPIVRLLNYLNRNLGNYCKYYIMEANNESTWTSVKRDINAFLTDVSNKGGLESFSLDVAATAYERSSKKMHVNVTVTPTETVEQIELVFFITKAQ